MTSRLRSRHIAMLVLSVLPLPTLHAQRNAQPRLDDGGQTEVINTYLYSGPTRGVDLRKRIRESVSSRISEILIVCQLDEPSEVRLQAAAQADTDRVLGRLRRIELQYRGTPVDGSEACRRAIAEIEEFKHELASGEPPQRSLVSRMLPKILTDEQEKKLEEHLQRRYQRRRVAACKCVIVDMERSMPMLGDQRQQLLSVMLAIEGPKRILPETQRAVGHWFIARVNLDNLEGKLDAGQIRVIREYQERWAGLDSAVE